MVKREVHLSGNATVQSKPWRMPKFSRLETNSKWPEKNVPFFFQWLDFYSKWTKKLNLNLSIR